MIEMVNTLIAVMLAFSCNFNGF